MSTITGTLTVQSTPITGTLTVDDTVITGTITPDNTVVNVTIGASNNVPGASAYAIAVSNGFVGDETAWLASLVGSDAAVPIEVTDHITRVDNPHNVQDSQIPDGIDYTLIFNNAIA